MIKESVRSSDFGSSFPTGMSSSGGSGINPGILLAVGAIALIIAILVFFLVVQRKKSFKGRFANWIKEYLNFRSVLITGIIKFLYLFLSVFLTIMSIIIMSQGKDNTVLQMVLVGLALLIAGNILLRITMELTMAMIVVWENTSDIRLLLVKRDEQSNVVKAPVDTKDPEAPEPTPAPIPEPAPTPEPTPTSTPELEQSPTTLDASNTPQPKA